MKVFFSKYNSAVIALSGGADSAAVLKLAVDFIDNKNVIAMTCINNHIFNYEIENARKIASVLAVKWIPFKSKMPNLFYENNKRRCYYCKNSILNYIENYRFENGIDVIFDGSNIDDLNEERAGFEAVKKHNVVSPLLETGKGKDFANEIVKFFERKRIYFNDESCIATRIKEQKITSELLNKIEKIENILRNDFKGIRIRIYPNELKIEFKNNYKATKEELSYINKIILNHF